MNKKFVYLDYDLGNKVAEEVKNKSKFLAKKGVKKILDYHCGNGRNSLYLARKGFLITAIDYPTFIKNFKKLVKKNKIPIKIKELREQTHYLPFKKNSFDVVLAWRILHRERLNQRIKILTELKRILSNKGYLLCSVSSNKDIQLDAQRRPHKKIEDSTYQYKSKGVINIRHYFTKKEIESGKAFPGFEILSIREITEKTGHLNEKYMRHYWTVLAQKKES